jgi:RNA polymerase sigma-70 factor (family 1)
MLHENLSDNQLTVLLRTGDEEAFAEIYVRYWKVLFYTAHNILQDQENARDIVQNVYVSLWNRRNEVEILSLKSYLQQAIRFLVFKTIRAQKQDAIFYARLKEITSEIIADNSLIFKEQQELLRKLLRSLPENCQETFRLSREEGFTYKQIASHLEISEKTVEKRLSKSLRHIRRGLNWEMCVTIIGSAPLIP